jgi:hypothetical protein
MLRFQPITERARLLLRGRRITLVRSVLTIGYYLHMRMALWFLRKDASGGPIVEQAIEGALRATDLRQSSYFVVAGHPEAAYDTAAARRDLGYAPEHNWPELRCFPDG